MLFFVSYDQNYSCWVQVSKSQLKNQHPIKNPPLSFLSFQSIRGLMFDILKIIQSELKFTFEMVEPVLMETNESDHWADQIKMLQRGEAEFSIMAIAMLDTRVGVTGTKFNNVIPKSFSSISR